MNTIFQAFGTSLHVTRGSAVVLCWGKATFYSDTYFRTQSYGKGKWMATIDSTRGGTKALLPSFSKTLIWH